MPVPSPDRACFVAERRSLDLRTMATEDPRVDAYIAKAAPFAQPILTHLRKSVQAACPDVVETIKWSMPFFVRADGRILANMAAFKQHCAFGFWRGRDAPGAGKAGEAMGQFGRIETLKDLPAARELKALIQAAAARTDDGASPPKKAAALRPALAMPDDFRAALANAPAARRNYEAFAPGKQREYVEWVLEAKRESTRAQRIAQAVAWLADGKARHWRYERG